MKILEIKKYPDKILREVCLPVKQIGERERRLFEEMFLTMRRASGIGLAAPQVGVNQRLIVADIGEGPLRLANPELIETKGTDIMEEGCLSVPGALVKVKRPYEVIVKGLNERGDSVEIKAKGLLARVLMHEIDHLDSKLIIDYMNFLQRLKYNLGNKRKE